MIDLKTISEKISEVLNSNNNPISQYQFLVATQGYHLDKISDRQTGKNVIPVFVSSLGGTINPVPELKQVEASVPITIYFPVRYKDDFFLLNEYLASVFVGKVVAFGNNSALSNISIAQYGEIVDVDLKEFKEWTGSIYRGEIEVMEPYMSMTITLYLNFVGYGESGVFGNLFFGNQVKITKIEITYLGTGTGFKTSLWGNTSTFSFSDTSPICIERADLASSENASQQILNTEYAKGYPANLAFTRQLPLIIKNNPSYYNLLRVCEDLKDIQNLKVSITESLPFTSALSVTHDYYVTNYSRKTAYGQLVGIQLTLADLGS